jgi:hypothetical protein
MMRLRMPTTTLAVTVAMAATYLVVLRLIDLNEKEPLWAIGMLFAAGGVAAMVLGLTVDSTLLELTVAPGVMLKELARFLAIAFGMGVLGTMAQSRGYSEVNGLMDGVVYGASGGLGFATGMAFTRELLLPLPDLLPTSSHAASFAELALVGLGDGLFGALMGIGFALALEARNPLQRSLAPMGGYAAAAGAHLVYDILGRGDALGDSALLRKWVALLLPVVVVAAVTVGALVRERRAIDEELEDEIETGAVNRDELAQLSSALKRELGYLRRLMRGDFSGWSTLHTLHNRQVQLAMAKRRAAREKDDGRRLAIGDEIAKLRSSVLELRAHLGFGFPPDAAPPDNAAPPPGDDDAGAGA